MRKTWAIMTQFLHETMQPLFKITHRLPTVLAWLMPAGVYTKIHESPFSFQLVVTFIFTSVFPDFTCFLKRCLLYNDFTLTTDRQISFDLRNKPDLQTYRAYTSYRFYVQVLTIFQSKKESPMYMYACYT